jgi:hypothetical protein
MYRIEFVSVGKRWMVVDGDDRVAFIGTMQQAEDWLDSQENLNRRPFHAGAWFRGLFQSWTRPVDRLAGACLRFFRARPVRR